MPRNRTLAALLGLCAGLAACEDTSTAPELAPADAANPQAAALRWSTTRLSIGNGLATDVNNQGQVVGYHSTNQGTRAFLWSNGTLQNLGTLGGGDSRAFAINETGQVVGQSTHGDRRRRTPSCGRTARCRISGALDADFSRRNRHRRQRPGGRLHREPRWQGERAFLWENGRMRRLAGLDTVHSVANGIDSQGRIVGWLRRSAARREPSAGRRAR